MNSSKELNGSKFHQSPTHYQKKQESLTHVAVQQILSQVPAKNLRNPDYFITSILNNPETKKVDVINPMGNSYLKKTGNDDFQTFRTDFQNSILENLKKEHGEKLDPEIYKAEMEKFQKNYEEFFRGYTPDVNSFKKYNEIKNNMNQAPSEKPNLQQMHNDPEFQKNMKKFFADETTNPGKPAQNYSNKPIKSPKKDAELVKSIQNCRYNPITGKYI